MENLPNRTRTAEVFNLPGFPTRKKSPASSVAGISLPFPQNSAFCKVLLLPLFQWKLSTLEVLYRTKKKKGIKNEKVVEVYFWMGKQSLKLA